MGRIAAFVLVVVCVASAADAKITLRSRTPLDDVFFHGSFSTDPFDPTTSFALQIWNCPDGAMPTYVPDDPPLVACAYDPTTGYTAADLVYGVAVPARTCADHGRSCYYRNSDVPSVTGGVRFFRVRYAAGDRPNRVWLDSWGDLSGATQANMLVLIAIDGRPRAMRTATFTALTSGGWYVR